MPSYYSEEEKRLVLENYATKGPTDLAGLLGRSPASVCRMAGILGVRITREQINRERLKTLGRLRRLHSGRLSDAEIASGLGCSPTAAAKARRQLGLSPGAGRVRARITLSSVARARYDADPFHRQYDPSARQEYAKRSGWPVNLCPLAVQLLNLLASFGVPATYADLLRAGAAPRRRWRSYLARLIQHGFVARISQGRRVVDRLGRHQFVPTYTLGHTALAILKERLACETTAPPPSPPPPKPGRRR